MSIIEKTASIERFREPRRNSKEGLIIRFWLHSRVRAGDLYWVMLLSILLRFIICSLWGPR